VPAVNIAVEAATSDAAPILDRLLHLYEYDFSEIGGIDVDANGLFPTADTAKLWGPHDHVYLIRVDGNVAGFAFVTAHESYIDGGACILLSEFFVLRKYRRRGVGERAARAVFDRFPGRWELSTARQNLAAQAFWRKVLARYTGGAYREVAEGTDRWKGPIWTFGR
jgi:predicted acetyltransferase